MNDLAVTKPRGIIDPRPIDPLALRREFPGSIGTTPGWCFSIPAPARKSPNRSSTASPNSTAATTPTSHRGVYQLSQRSTDAFEAAREATRAFLNAADVNEIVFTRGATESINLVAQKLGPAFVKEGDEIIVSELEHHSNFVPWQMLCERVGARLRVAPIGADGGFDLAAFEAMLSPRTKVVAVTHVSNVSGMRSSPSSASPNWRMHGVGAPRCWLTAARRCRACRSISRRSAATSTSSPAIRPTARRGSACCGAATTCWRRCRPGQTGGGMITHYGLTPGERTEFQDPPHRFEAGTPDISGAVGLKLALDFIESLGREAIREHEEELTGYAIDRLSRIAGLNLVAAGQRRLSVLSFNLDGIHPHDVGTVLDQHGVAVRVGHHCAQPLMDKLGVAGTVRASLGVYNDRDDIDALAASGRGVSGDGRFRR